MPPAVMRWYRDFPTEGAGAVLHLSRPADCAASDPVPARALGQADVRPARRLTTATTPRRPLTRPARPCRSRSSTGWADRLSGAAEHVRCAQSAGHAMVLEGRLRQVAARRGDRRHMSPRRRKRRASFSLMHLYPIDGAVHRGRQGRHGMGRARRDVVDGDRRDRSRSGEGGRTDELGNGLLGGGASLQSRRRLPQLHDGRRGRGAGQGEPTATTIRASRR